MARLFIKNRQGFIMLLKKLYLSSALFLLAPVMANAGFGLEATRVIYNQGARSEPIVAFNTDNNRNYLLQSWVESSNGEASTDFVVTPPLVKLRANQKNTLQITQTAVLPADRESLYWLNIKFIPPADASLENSLNFSMTNRVKIIYRPVALKNIEISKEVEKLTFTKNNNSLVINNPTASYININKIIINGNKLASPSYISPKDKVEIKINQKEKGGNALTFYYVNDLGRVVEKSVSI